MPDSVKTFTNLCFFFPYLMPEFLKSLVDTAEYMCRMTERQRGRGTQNERDKMSKASESGLFEVWLVSDIEDDYGRIIARTWRKHAEYATSEELAWHLRNTYDCEMELDIREPAAYRARMLEMQARKYARSQQAYRQSEEFNEIPF